MKHRPSITRRSADGTYKPMISQRRCSANKHSVTQLAHIGKIASLGIMHRLREERNGAQAANAREVDPGEDRSAGLGLSAIPG